MVDEYDDDDESVAMASRRSVLEECLRWYMTEYDVDQEEALEIALGRVRRRYAWLTLPALKHYFSLAPSPRIRNWPRAEICLRPNLPRNLPQALPRIPSPEPSPEMAPGRRAELGPKCLDRIFPNEATRFFDRGPKS